MRKHIFLLTFLLTLAVYGTAQTKRALIIAIANYPDPKVNGWKVLHSLNDVPLIDNALLKQGFLKENINIIIDSEATRRGIENALDKLVDAAKKGDVVVIHFSGHGEQIQDDNGDEIDGYDECLVPYGAQYSKDRTLFNKMALEYFRDDVFGEKITLLRNRLGKAGDILVILDACHSGSGTRGGNAVIRGDNSPMVGTDFDPKKIMVNDTAVFKDNNGTKVNDDAATYVIISGAQAQQRNAECYDDQEKPVGSLSYAISKTLLTMKDTITYRTLFARIEDVMRDKAETEDQQPVIEGDGIDRKLFGGRVEVQKLFFTINRDSSNEQSIVLKAGTVSGVTVGSVVSFYPQGTEDPEKATALQKGTVMAANSFSAAIKLDKEDAGLVSKNPYAFVTAFKYGIDKIKLNTDALPNETVQKLKDGLKDIQSIEFNAVSDLMLVDSKSVGKLALTNPVSGTIFADDLDINDPASIKDALKRFDRFRYLRNLKFDEPGLSATVEFVFLDANKNIDEKKMRERTKMGPLQLKQIDDEVYIKIKNTGTKDFFYNIIEMSADGSISPVFPNANLVDPVTHLPKPSMPEELILEADSTKILKQWKLAFDCPCGEETFKVFLSTQPLDLEALLTTKSGARSVLSDLERVFKNSKPDNTGKRGGSGTINTSDNGTIFGLNFRVVPR